MKDLKRKRNSWPLLNVCSNDLSTYPDVFELNKEVLVKKENSQYMDLKPKYSTTILVETTINSVADKAHTKKKLNCKTVLKTLMVEYSQNSTIHGIRYFFDFERPFYERVYWLAFFIIFLGLSGVLIWSTYLKWLQIPVIFTYDETFVPIYKIPFPTVTICPEYGTNIEFTNIEDMYSLDLTQLFFYSLQNLALFSIIKEIGGAPFCKWNGRFYLCFHIWKNVATDAGLCFQFNGLNASDLYRDEMYVEYIDYDMIDFTQFINDMPELNNITGSWSLEKGYIHQGFHSYPQRTVYSTIRNGFIAFLAGLEHKQGYRVFLHSPDSLPSTTDNYILVPADYEVIVKITPQYKVSSKDLQYLSPEIRNCYFESERYLRYFRFYSQNNCEIECLSNFTISKCGCAKIWMPKPYNVTACDRTQLKCFYDAKEELNLLLQNQTLQKSINPKVEIICNCLPACTSLEYNFEISRAQYNLTKVLEARRAKPEILRNDDLATRLIVYFKEHQFSAIKRQATSWFPNSICIFAMFTGISALSILELIFFCVVRSFNDLWRNRQM